MYVSNTDYQNSAKSLEGLTVNQKQKIAIIVFLVLSISSSIGPSFNVAADSTLITSIPDINESDVNDGYDFQTVSFYKEETNMKIVVSFYATYAFTFPSSFFWIVVDTVPGGISEVKMQCTTTNVYIDANPSGAHLYYGHPTISGNTYTIIFNYDTVFGGTNVIYPRLYSQGSSDTVNQFTVNWPTLHYLVHHKQKAQLMQQTCTI